MGFDVTYHPISEREITEWYFDRLREIEQNNLVVFNELVQRFNIDEFYAKKYMTTLQAGVTSIKMKNEPFDKTHGFYAAVVQGFFRKYFYTRGSAFSFLLDENPEFISYTTSWQKILGKEIVSPIQNKIVENYSSGVFISYPQIETLFRDYNNNLDIKEKIDTLFSHGRIDVFLQAVTYCRENKLGLLEATEVAEPNPMNLNESESFSDFFNHCAQEGPILYREAALAQLAEATEKMSNTKNQAHNAKSNFFSKFFKKNK